MLMRRLACTIAAVTGLFVLWPAPVLAHNSLVEAVPAKDTALAELPAEVSLRFLATLKPDTTLTVTDAQGAGAIGPVTITGKVISAPFIGTAGGVYTVGYGVTADDGHVADNSYTFTVQAKGKTGSPAVLTVTPVPVPLPKKSETPWLPYIGGAAVAGLLVGGLIAFLRRNRS